MYKILFLFLLIPSIAQATITASDPTGNDYAYSFIEGSEETIEILITADDLTEEITSTRIFGSGLSFVENCQQSFSGGLTCLASITVSATAIGNKRIEFRTASRQRLRISISISRTADDAATIDENQYSSLISATPSSSIDFGIVSDKVRQFIYVKNNGNNQTDILALINLITPGYTKVSDQCSGSRIPPRGTCRLIVDFDARELFGGVYDQEVRIEPVGGSSSPHIISFTAEVVEPPRAKVEVLAGVEKVDPTACLALNGINPSECYYEADLASTGSTTIGAVFCDENTSTCSVNVNHQVANEPVEFNIAINFPDQEVIDDDNASNENGSNPFDFTLTSNNQNLGDIELGSSMVFTVSLTNDSGTQSLPLAYVESIIQGASEVVQITNDCSLLAQDESCSYFVEVSPTSLGAKTVDFQMQAAGETKTIQLSFTGINPPDPSMNMITYDDGATYDDGSVYQ